MYVYKVNARPMCPDLGNPCEYLFPELSACADYAHMSVSGRLSPPYVSETGPWFNIKMPSYQYRKSHCGDKTVVRSSYLHNGISYTGKMVSFHWISPQEPERD